MKRRSLLLGTAAFSLSQLAGGCRSQSTLKVRPLKGTIPAQLVARFRKSLKPAPALQVTPQPQLTDLFVQLQQWQQKALASQPVEDLADVVMVGDYWLAKAIEQKLIRPLEVSQLPSWGKLPAPWQNLVRRNAAGMLDAKGQVWAAPYRWGTTVIIYRTDRFKTLGWTPTDWSDLWREELRGRVSLLESPREVIGLTLKKLGSSYNTPDLQRVPQLQAELTRLQQQVKLYSSTAYLQPLMLGDTWVAVGWSQDILPLLKTERNVGVIVPQSGTALWADLWVQPAGAVGNVSLAQQWIDFCWRPEIATQLSLLTWGSSPIVAGMQSEALPAELRLNRVLWPGPDILAKSEFLFPLSDTTRKQYSSLWQEIRGL